MESYGVFIEIGENLIGLCHISQITNKFIKSPKEVVKTGDTVSAKIIALDGDRISLSMKALEDDVPDAKEDTYEIPDEFCEAAQRNKIVIYKERNYHDK